VPSEADWGNYQNDLDQNHAHQMFAGKTNAEVQHYFLENPLALTDELRWMPRIPFQYYMIGFRDFIKAGVFEPTWASDAASCFLGLVLEKLQNHPLNILPIMPELLPTIEYVASNQEKFDANESIYGSFPEILKQIKALFDRYSGR